MGWRFTFGGTLKVQTADERLAELEEDPFASKWNGGTVVDLDDLSSDVFDAIAAKEPGLSWWTLYQHPGSSASRLFQIVTAAAAYAQLDVPEKPKTMRDTLALLERLEPTENAIGNGLPTAPSEGIPSSDGQSDGSGGSQAT